MNKLSYTCDCGKTYDMSFYADWVEWKHKKPQAKNFVKPENEGKELGSRIRVPAKVETYKKMLIKSGVKFRDHIIPKNLLDKVLKWEWEQNR